MPLYDEFAVAQTTGYTCGPCSLLFFLRMHGIEPKCNERGLARILKTTVHRGTEPESMAGYLRQFRQLGNVCAMHGTHSIIAPSIVLYQGDARERECDHYSVIIQECPKSIVLYDPWCGKIKRCGKSAFFKKWHSKLYGLHRFAIWMEK